MCGRGGLVRFLGVRLGVATWFKKLAPRPCLLAFIVFEILTFIRTDGHG